MINAFMEGIKAAKENKKAVDNPFSHGQNRDQYSKDLWDKGFLFQLEQDANVR